jgi:hypothetical protein
MGWVKNRSRVKKARAVILSPEGGSLRARSKREMVKRLSGTPRQKLANPMWNAPLKLSGNPRRESQLGWKGGGFSDLLWGWVWKEWRRHSRERGRRRRVRERVIL